MTLIEDREAFEPRLGKRVEELDTSPYDESGSEEEYLIANEGYTDNGENNNRDFFSLPTLGLNYLNNLNLSLNLNLNLRNSSLWRIYENSTFPKTGFLSNYLGKQEGEEEEDHHHHHHGLDINAHNHDDLTPDSRGYFTLANFLRHTFQSYEEEFSDEAILERLRFKELPTVEKSERSHLVDSLIDFRKQENRRLLSVSNSTTPTDNCTESAEEQRIENSSTKVEEACGDDINQQEDMSQNPVSTSQRNPFYYRAELSLWNKIMIAVGSIVFLPIKLVLMIIFLSLALLLVCIGMYGVSFEESQSKPLAKWRRAFRWVLANVVMRGFVFCAGFHWKIKKTGKIAKPHEAPIFVVGPHSSYFDAFVVILMGAPSVVAKLSTKDVFVFGRLVTLTQAVYVSRESKEGRKQTMEVLKERARGVYEGNGMPQIFIFPEGTCSNRSSLIKFKAGAFAPQVPIQPVLIKYPNTLDAVTWTFDGPPCLKNIWYALSLPYHNIEIEYLPVYVPNEEEKKDVGLYAENVRRVMADALGVPTSEYQYEDGALLANMRESTLPSKLRAIHRAKKALGLNRSTIECALIFENSFIKIDYRYGFQKFQEKFFHVNHVDTIIPEVQTAYNSFKRENEETIDIRPYLILTCILYPEKSIKIRDMPKRICELHYGTDVITEGDVRKLLEYVFLGSNDAPEYSLKENGAGEDNSEPLNKEAISQLMCRHCEFAKLFADEVAERLPLTYPKRSERDKPSPHAHLD